MTPSLISSTPYRGGQVALVWIQTQSDGVETVYGSFFGIRPAAEDVSAYLTLHAAQLVDRLAAAEIDYALSQIAQNGSLAVFPAFRYAAQSDALAAIRAFYAVAARDQAIMLGDYLGTLSDATLRNLFNMTAAQVTSLRTNKLTPAASLATSIRAAAGA